MGNINQPGYSGYKGPAPKPAPGRPKPGGISGRHSKHRASRIIGPKGETLWEKKPKVEPKSKSSMQDYYKKKGMTYSNPGAVHSKARAKGKMGS